mmetsp:Transcript_25077/g.35360  ORF Transcript_25077/g.35360 Transcript_25077/m.35360 type:complete len:274 (-) Transcript_25077:716-1537(-)
MLLVRLAAPARLLPGLETMGKAAEQVSSSSPPSVPAAPVSAAEGREVAGEEAVSFPSSRFSCFPWLGGSARGIASMSKESLSLCPSMIDCRSSASKVENKLAVEAWCRNDGWLRDPRRSTESSEPDPSSSNVSNAGFASLSPSSVIHATKTAKLAGSNSSVSLSFFFTSASTVGNCMYVAPLSTTHLSTRANSIQAVSSNRCPSAIVSLRANSEKRGFCIRGWAKPPVGLRLVRVSTSLTTATTLIMAVLMGYERLSCWAMRDLHSFVYRQPQ